MESEDNTRIFEVPILGSVTVHLIESETKPVVTIACEVNGKTITASIRFAPGCNDSARAMFDGLTPELAVGTMLECLAQTIEQWYDDDDDDDDAEYEEATRTH